MGGPAAIPPLFLLRHGQTEWNRAGRLQGHLDSPLTGTGRSQALRMRDLLPDPAGMLRLSSPLGRAVETARLVFGPLPFQTDARLAEIALGDWSGADHAALAAREGISGGISGDAPRHWYCAAPGGEGLEGLAARVADFLADLPARAGARPVAIVTHGVTLSMLRAQVLGVDFETDFAAYHPQDAVHALAGGTACLIQRTAL